MLKLLAGCVAGSLEATATWPLEYIKTQMQTKRKVPVKGGFVSVPQPYTSIYAGLRYTVRTTGALSLFTGLTPTLLLSAPKAGIRFGTNQQLRSARPAEPSDKLEPSPNVHQHSCVASQHTARRTHSACTVHTVHAQRTCAMNMNMNMNMKCTCMCMCMWLAAPKHVSREATTSPN